MGKFRISSTYQGGRLLDLSSAMRNSQIAPYPGLYRVKLGKFDKHFWGKGLQRRSAKNWKLNVLLDILENLVEALYLHKSSGKALRKIALKSVVKVILMENSICLAELVFEFVNLLSSAILKIKFKKYRNLCGLNNGYIGLLFDQKPPALEELCISRYHSFVAFTIHYRENIWPLWGDGREGLHT